ncbi:MAG: ATP-dependent zinc metalloprotease FtsH [Eubacteriales bacterium]|nr:ATP-dependent zinc metalloprotease FtsH [Eubacteriales bacterium]MDD3881844.1 ATP-dependent zinc metalloprotease FtsH [Eubacteriales bacterium]MDD4512910.1 ATP-dependent zinc metalloprotease FtsH [Eubacteriales bacterium]
MELEPKTRKGLLYYVTVVAVVMLLLNIFVFPSLLQTRVTEVAYSEFVKMLDAGEIKQVQMNEAESVIVFSSEQTVNGKAQMMFYKTGIWPDDGLTQKLVDKGVQFTNTIPTQASPLISFVISWVLPLVLFIVVGRFLTKKMMGGMGNNAMSFGKANAKIYAQTETGITFADVAGEDEAKDALREIVEFMHAPQRYSDIGAVLPKGALLVGPPGTGKTMLAKAVAGEAKVPFFSISGSEFVEMFVGMGAAKVRDLFKQAGEKAPCIVFIDEIDAIGKKRDSSPMGGNDEREQTLNQLLSEMDGFDAAKGVVILAATNRPDSLDKALLRPGRFDRRIPVELPDLAGREAILRVHAKKVKMEDNVDYNLIARATAGASGAELANIINEGALRAVREGRDKVSQLDLQESVEVVVAGYQRKNAVISVKEKELIAYHEIGHALVAASQSGTAPVTKITIVPRTSGALGYTMQVEEGESVLLSRKDALSQLATLTGGRAAEEVKFNTMTSGASNDIEKATALARAMITRYGMSNSFGMVQLEQQSDRYLGGGSSLICSADAAARIDAEVAQLIGGAHEKAVGILKDNREALDALAGYLLEKETITGEEFMEILGKHRNAKA